MNKIALCTLVFGASVAAFQPAQARDAAETSERCQTAEPLQRGRRISCTFPLASCTICASHWNDSSASVGFLLSSFIGVLGRRQTRAIRASTRRTAPRP